MLTQPCVSRVQKNLDYTRVFQTPGDEMSLSEVNEWTETSDKVSEAGPSRNRSRFGENEFGDYESHYNEITRKRKEQNDLNFGLR